MAKILKNQLWHVLILAVLLILTSRYVQLEDTALSGSLWGISTKTWLILTILAPIIHQVYVLFCWRSELYYKGISKRWGKKGFRIFKIGFAFLILCRPITITLLAISNAFTFSMNTILSYIIATVLFLPAVYLFYSLKKYFGIDRAFGIDHFDPDMYRSAPMVKEGIFNYTSNGMYVFGFFLLWLPGILLFSKAALLAALFNHIYIWVHYYFTELPDMKEIYADVKVKE